MENNQPPRFGGEPGTPVPQVDFDDLKAVSRMQQEMMKAHPGKQIQLGAMAASTVCKAGADIAAISYRLGQLGVLQLLVTLNVITQEKLSRIIHEDEYTDAALRVIATMPLEWMAPGVVRQGLPFDWEQFLQRSAA